MEALQQFLPLIIITLPIVFICNSLAKEKGKNVMLWTILGIIPGVNYYSLLYLASASNNFTDKKIDKILVILQKESGYNYNKDSKEI